jgi:hypothetical protein
MDETTYSSIEKSGNNYQIKSFSLPALTSWNEVDPSAQLTVSASKVDMSTFYYNSVNTNINYNIDSTVGDFTLDFERYITSWTNGVVGVYGHAVGVTQITSTTYYGITPSAIIAYSDVYYGKMRLGKYYNGTSQNAGGGVTITTGVLYYLRLSRSGSTVTLGVFSDAARTVHVEGSPVSFTEITIESYNNIIAAWNSSVNPSVETGYIQNISITGAGLISGNILSNAISSDSAVLSFFKHLKTLVSNGASTHATPVQAEIYGNADSYASALNTTKFTIDPNDPRINLKRDGLDTITAGSNNQTVWNMTVAGGMPALPDHGTILATQVGVAAVLAVEKSVNGNFTDTVVLAENTDYTVDYSTRTATKITLSASAASGIVSGTSKIRLSWIADVMKIDGGTNNTALKVKMYLNRTTGAETSPSIQPIDLGTSKHIEMLYGE